MIQEIHSLRPFPSDNSVPCKTLPCDSLSCWSDWQSEILTYQCDWRSAPKEIILEAQIKYGNSVQNVRVLVDTGARVPIAFRKGLVEESQLIKAQFPGRFSVADGQPNERWYI